MSNIAGSFLRSPFLKYAHRTTLDVLQSITQNKQLIGVLTAQFGDYGLTPGRSSFGMHALVVNHYYNGGYYPIGGASKIAEAIEPVIEAAGGKLYTNAEVSRVILKGNKAVGVKMADEKELFAGLIISDAGVLNTYSKLLPETNRNHKDIEQVLKHVKPSTAHVSLYIGLQQSAQELRLPKTNYWIFPDNYDHDENLQYALQDPLGSFQFTFISFPSAKNPDFEKLYPGKSTIEVIGFLPYKLFSAWADTKWHHRGEVYEVLKEKISEKLLEQLYRFVPQVKGKIDVMELSTPLSTKNFTNYSQGEIYGIERTPENLTLKFLRPKTPVKHLYLTGQDISTCGIAGAMLGGLLTASYILKRNISHSLLKK